MKSNNKGKERTEWSWKLSNILFAESISRDKNLSKQILERLFETTWSVADFYCIACVKSWLKWINGMCITIMLKIFFFALCFSSLLVFFFYIICSVTRNLFGKNKYVTSIYLSENLLPENSFSKFSKETRNLPNKKC